MMTTGHVRSPWKMTDTYQMIALLDLDHLMTLSEQILTKLCSHLRQTLLIYKLPIPAWDSLRRPRFDSQRD